MDRLNRLVLGGGLGLILAASGCRTPRSEVPLGRPLVKDPAAATTPPVQFSSDPAQQIMPPSMGQPNAAGGNAMPPTSANLSGQSANYLGGAVPGGAPAPALMDSIPTTPGGPQVPTPPRPTFAPPTDPAAAAGPAEAAAVAPPASAELPASAEMPPLDGGK